MGRRYLSALSLLLLLISSFALPSYVRADDTPDGYVADEIVIKLFGSSDLAAVATQYNLALPPLDQFGTRPIYRLRISDGMGPEEKATELLGDARIEFAEPNFLAQTPEGRGGRKRWAIGESEQGYAEQWSPSKIRLAEASTVNSGSGITVAVLDTGVDRNHPRLSQRLLNGFDFVDFDDDPSEEGVYGVDFGYGHGTHVAGLVALVAPDAQILPVRVLDTEGVGNIWVLTEGLLYAIDPDGNPATDDGAQVINMSLGTLRRTELLDRIIAEVSCASSSDDDDDDNGLADDDDDDGGDDDDARCQRTGGAVVIAAAGNGGNQVPQYPAGEGVAGSLAVAASTASDRLASFSTHGAWVKISAPGDDIISSVPDDSYGTWSGTSMAAPHVAGVAALVRAQQPTLNATAVVDKLVLSAQPICGSAPNRLDAAAALGLAKAGPTDCTSYSIFFPLYRLSGWGRVNENSEARPG
ncbi:S8 family serine peptidase [Candidatus Gracilibacteria bacterium]|nr:S8 family serine peptidase [Candidatus Gracilibacteria bacterium]